MHDIDCTDHVDSERQISDPVDRGASGTTRYSPEGLGNRQRRRLEEVDSHTTCHCDLLLRAWDLAVVAIPTLRAGSPN